MQWILTHLSIHGNVKADKLRKAANFPQPLLHSPSLNSFLSKNLHLRQSLIPPVYHRYRGKKPVRVMSLIACDSGSKFALCRLASGHLHLLIYQSRLKQSLFHFYQMSRSAGPCVTHSGRHGPL